MRRASFATTSARRSPGSRTRPGTSSRSSSHPLAADDLLEVARLRLRNHRVTGAKLSSAAEVVSWLGCVQAQEYQLSKWSLGMRVSPTLRDSDVDAALARGAILRTHILRPTALRRARRHPDLHAPHGTARPGRVRWQGSAA